MDKISNDNSVKIGPQLTHIFIRNSSKELIYYKILFRNRKLNLIAFTIFAPFCEGRVLSNENARWVRRELESRTLQIDWQYTVENKIILFYLSSNVKKTIWGKTYHIYVETLCIQKSICFGNRPVLFFFFSDPDMKRTSQTRHKIEVSLLLF